MNRGSTERETCELNGWGVGTVLRGYEGWSSGCGVWSTIRITAIGERDILARCIRHETIAADGSVEKDRTCGDREGRWTLRHREWSEVAATQAALKVQEA